MLSPLLFLRLFSCSGLQCGFALTRCLGLGCGSTILIFHCGGGCVGKMGHPFGPRPDVQCRLRLCIGFNVFVASVLDRQPCGRCCRTKVSVVGSYLVSSHCQQGIQRCIVCYPLLYLFFFFFFFFLLLLLFFFCFTPIMPHV